MNSQRWQHDIKTAYFEVQLKARKDYFEEVAAINGDGEGED